jgi:parallel beta-helix repeat protein
MNIRAFALAVAVALFAAPRALPQGPLIPPSGPAPTMRSLDQLDAKVDQNGTKLDQANTKLDSTASKVDEIRSKAEKRIALTAADSAPGVDTANPDYHFIINQPGSYNLPANLGVTKTHGIQINAEGVTLDLNGFEISRASGSGGNGIEIAATGHRASVRNGSIKGFAGGVNASSRACAFRGLAVSNCTGFGISSGEAAVVEACRAHDNSGFAGILAGVGSTVTDCTAANNSATYGIYADNGSTVTNCSARSNQSSDATSAGIGTGAGCTVSNCTAYLNTSTAASSTPTTGMGFTVGEGTTVQRCTARANEGDGIRIINDTAARDNTCDTNGNLGGDGAGIHATGSDNRIEGNNVTDNDRGIDVDVAGNLIIKNSATGNGPTNNLNYDIAANNVFGAIVDRTAPASAAVTGNSAGSSAGTTDPWANFTY